ncbi:hypothetical protein T492DRAFT_268935 [Pavlovales sp. CCMP2436]|nr:hypothetical protein T492DRAFT_268935 [Pavlovales sp. CCMP2436]|mmetsp:Transcript_21961/g.55705  ORF Transcript_21961/g.55705 Transcript_21961/m.55705 type:complete len:162 (+) Transcript_21961:174-659(+)
MVAQAIAGAHLPTLICALKGAARGGTDPGACRPAGFAAEILEHVLITVPGARATLSKLGARLPLHLLIYKNSIPAAMGVLRAAKSYLRSCALRARNTLRSAPSSSRGLRTRASWWEHCAQARPRSPTCVRPCTMSLSIFRTGARSVPRACCCRARATSASC